MKVAISIKSKHQDLSNLDREMKKKYVSDAIKTQRLQEINEVLDDTNTQISLLTRQREMHVNFKQFGLAANVTEQMS